MVRGALLGACLVLTLTLDWSSCFAQNKNNRDLARERKDDQKIKDAKEDVKEAQDKLKDDQKALQDAQKAVAEAEAKEKTARQKLDEIRKRIESKAESGSGIDKALAAQEAARKTFDEAAAPVLKTLKGTPAYQAAAKKAAGADARLKTIRADESLSIEAKRRELVLASKDKLATSELEQAALEADPSAKSARAKLADAQDRVNQIRAKIRNQIDSNPEIQSSLQAMRSAAEATEIAGQKMQRIRDKIAADNAKLTREQQQVKQAEAADKANDNKNKKPNNKGKK